MQTIYYCGIKMNYNSKTGGAQERNRRCPKRNGSHWGCCCYCEWAEGCEERCLNDAAICGLLQIKEIKERKNG